MILLWLLQLSWKNLHRHPVNAGFYGLDYTCIASVWSKLVSTLGDWLGGSLSGLEISERRCISSYIKII